MSVVVGVADADRVWIGTSSAATDGYGRVWEYSPYENLVCKKAEVQNGSGEKGEFIIATVGDSALHELLRHRHVSDGVPDPTDEASRQGWAWSISEALTELAWEHKGTEGAMDGAALLGYAGQLWYLTSQGAHHIPFLGGIAYTAIGSGGDLALGALEGARGHGASIDADGVMRRIHVALKAAFRYDRDSIGPARIMKIDHP